jgi:hypothetical protein
VTRVRDSMAQTRDFTPRESPDLDESLRNLGAWLYDGVFQKTVGNALERLCRVSQPLRIFLEIKDPWLQQTPWESLYVPNLRTSLGLTRKISLLRYLRSASPLSPHPISQPFRVLVVLPAPRDLPLIGSDHEVELLDRTLASAVKNKQVVLKFLRGPEASWEGLQRTLRVFRPHVFHFVGHGIYDAQKQQGALALQREE